MELIFGTMPVPIYTGVQVARVDLYLVDVHYRPGVRAFKLILLHCIVLRTT